MIKKTIALVVMISGYIWGSVDLANTYGIATQGTVESSGYHYYLPAKDVIDGNNETYNHTRDTQENWVQIAFPVSSNISSLKIIVGNSGSSYRLKDAKVYIRNRPYHTGDTLNSNDAVATLVGNISEQVFSFSKVREGKYILIKAESGRNLHLSTVEAYGTMHETIHTLISVDLANKYGFASQGTKADTGYHYYNKANNSIDGDETTSNHTRDNAENWIQVAFPSSVNISKFVIKSRDASSWRLKDAKVYIRNKAYKTGDALKLEDAVATLEGTGNIQNIRLDSSKQGKYILIKAKEGYHLHLSLLKAYGVIAEDIDIANKYGIATQGTLARSNYHYYLPAKDVIDGNNETYNHTRDNAENWVQIAFPKSTNISAIKVKVGNSGSSYRLRDAKVYIRNTPYHTGDALDSHDAVATLEGHTNTQYFGFDQHKMGEYILIKSNSGRNLHLSTVEAYGTINETLTNLMSVDLANKYGFASQGTKPGYQYYYEAGNSIDGDETTYHHTRDNDENWLQVAFPTAVNISKFVIKSRNSASWRLKDAKVYVRDKPYKSGDTLNESDAVATLHGTGDRQTITLDKSVQGKYILIKAKEGQHLHLSLVQAYGSIDKNIATFLQHNLAKKYGHATQGTKADSNYYYYTPAVYSIDEDKSTSNHTRDNAENWIQVAFPSAINMAKLIIKNRDASSWRLNHAKVYIRNKPYKTGDTLNEADAVATLSGTSDAQVRTLEKNKQGKYLLVKAEEGKNLHLSLLEVYGIVFGLEGCTSDADCEGVCDMTGTVNTCALSQVCGNGRIDLSEVCDDGNSQSADGCSHTCQVEDATETFWKEAQRFKQTSTPDTLLRSYTTLVHEETQENYNNYMLNSLSTSDWESIEKHPEVKEALYATGNPVNPHYIKNYIDFIHKWKEVGKSDAFIEKYRNVAIGFAINAREAGIFKTLVFGDTSEHKTVDYKDVDRGNAAIVQWVNHFNFNGSTLSYAEASTYAQNKYRLSTSERKDIWYARTALKNIKNAGYSVTEITPEIRAQYTLSFDGLNIFRLFSGLERADCFATGNPCEKIQTYLAKEDVSITPNTFLEEFEHYKDVANIISPHKSITSTLRGFLGIIPKEQNTYKLMSFYDLATWKIANDNIAPKDFGDEEPNWPIFQSKLSALPWQILALEQGAQKKECKYVRERFFETDKAKLIASFPPNSVSLIDRSEKRFQEYTRYTKTYEAPKVVFRTSEWSTLSVYRVMQDGGVCGRLSIMGQHVNECLNRPSIGVGQPAHRAWLGVYNLTDNPKQYEVNIGYQLRSRESASAHSSLLYNQYTSAISHEGMEKFTGVVTGTSPASAGEHIYTQSMTLQHIAKRLEDKGYSAEATLRKAIALVPQNVDAWYQLALYYAHRDEPEKVIALAKEFMTNRDSFFLDRDTRKGAGNLEIVTGKNIAFALIYAPSIDEGKGEKAAWGKEALMHYLDTYEADNRSIRSYNRLNKYLANYYIAKQNDEEGFVTAMETLLEYMVTHHRTDQEKRYFYNVQFGNIDKAALYDRLQTVINRVSSSDHERRVLTDEVLNRKANTLLQNLTLSDICTNSTLSQCQSIGSIEIDAKDVYALVDRNIGDSQITPTSSMGENTYSTLHIPIIDDLGDEEELIVRIAKVTSNHDTDSLLKINDPSNRNPSMSTFIAWINPEDNDLQAERIYKTVDKVMLTIMQKSENTEKVLGIIYIHIKDLLKAHNVTLTSKEYQTKDYPDTSTANYFVALDSKVGPSKGAWSIGGDTLLKVPVKDESGDIHTLTLRARNDHGYAMHSGKGAGSNSFLNIRYEVEDNPAFVSGQRYVSIKPFAIDTKAWHHAHKIIKRVHYSIDILF